MDRTYWHKQVADSPLFPNILWSRPENKRQRGRLLVAGGSAVQFSALNQAFDTTKAAGAGYVSLATPDSLSKVIPSGPETFFLPSSKTNTFAKEAGPQLKKLAAEHDGTLIVGDLGRSNETQQAISALLVSSKAQVTLTKDAVDLFYAEPHVVLDRDNTIIVASFSQLQKLLSGQTLLSSSMGLVKLVETLHGLNAKATIVTQAEQSIIVCHDGDVSTTKLSVEADKLWQVHVACFVSVFAMQFPQDRFQAVTTAIHLANNT